MKTYNSRFRLLFGALCAMFCLLDARAQVNVSIGTIANGESVMLTYEVVIDPSVSPAVTEISSQGQISGTGFTAFSTDDPETPADGDATITALQNDPPAVDLNGAGAGTDVTVAFTEQVGVLISPAAAITDAEGNTIQSLAVTLITRPDGNSVESLSLNSAAATAASGLSVVYTEGSGVLSISGGASAAVYQSILRGVLYNNTSDNPAASDRSVTIVASDGNAGAAQTSTITIAAVNDAPVMSAGNTISYTEQAAATAISALLNVTDADNVDLAGATVSISSGFVAGDTLGFTDQNGISGSYNSGTGVLTLSGSSSVANYQAALRSVRFSSSSDNPTAGGASVSRTVTFVAEDGAASSADVTATINVSAVNDNPLAVTDTIFRPPDGNVKVKIATLLANDSDVENQALTFTGVLSSGSGTAVVSGEWILYTRSGVTADSFTYTINDGNGGTATGTVNVDIQDENTQSSTAITISMNPGGGVELVFDGIPNRTYTIQSRGTVSESWADIGTASTSILGQYRFNHGTGDPARLYRYIYRP